MSKQLKKFQQINQLEEQSHQQAIQLNQRHYGACLILARYENGEPKLTLGPHYYVFIFALLALTGLLVWLLVAMKEQLTIFWLGAMIICTVVFVFSYLNIGLSVPGFASRAQEPTLQQKNHPKYCKPCKIVKNDNIYHCYDCDVCIEGYDHHCPWIGKCVGKTNLCSFYFFLFMTFGTLLLCFVSTLASSNIHQSKLRSASDQSQKYSVKS